MLKNNKKIDLFFDEIHKGGSTDNSEYIMLSLINEGITIDFFIMVTATFAKPTDFYENIVIGNPSPKIIEWSYNDQQNMKDVINETKKQQMINSRTDLTQKEELEKLFDERQVYDGIDYLEILSSEYKKYPELVLINPEIINSENTDRETSKIMDVLNKLDCKACISHDEKLLEDAIAHTQILKIYFNKTSVNNLLNELVKIYNYFQTKIKYPISSPHTNYGFLDKNLYDGERCEIERNTTKRNQRGRRDKRAEKRGNNRGGRRGCKYTKE